MTFNGYALWIWECIHDDCFGCSRLPLSRKSARRCGVKHLQKYHDDYESEPIMTKVGG